MFFTNLLAYRLTKEIDLSAETLEAALANKPARACGSQEMSTYGFIRPYSNDEGEGAFAYAVEGYVIIAALSETRVLPASVIKDALKEKIKEIETSQQRKVYKKERDTLKDEIIQALLPRTFTRKSSTYAAIDVANQIMYVNSASPARAEDLLSTLREAIGSLPIRPVAVKIAPSATMTDWVKTQKAAEHFVVLDECELRDTHEDGGTVRCKRQDLTSEEIKQHLDVGKQVTQLSIGWQDKLSFVLNDKLIIKRLRFEELLSDQAEQDGGDDRQAVNQATILIMMKTFAEFMPQLLEALGGEEIPQGI